MNILRLLPLFAFIISCSSVRHSTQADYMSDSSYRNKAELTESLFSKDETPMSESSIQKALNSRIKLAKMERLTVVKIDQKRDYRSNSVWVNPRASNDQSFTLDDNIKRKLFKKLNSSRRIRDVSVIPSLLLKKDKTLRNLRESAARMQSSLLLVLRSNNIIDFDHNVFEKNKVKVTSNVEALLLDVKTGVIPFTSIATDSTELKEQKDDISRDELIRRAILKVESGAFSEITDDAVRFLNKLP